jgi:hypothetical protein
VEIDADRLQRFGVTLPEPQRALPCELRDVETHGGHVDPHVLEGPCAGSIALAKQAEEQVFRADVKVPQVPGFLVRNSTTCRAVSVKRSNNPITPAS